jgi:hypothetical protein
MKNSLWTIIEPPKELRKMDIKEMAKYYSEKTMVSAKMKDIKSLVTGRSLEESMGFVLLTELEIEGLWTIEGIFEEVETNG